jgi:hypothetical protein
MIKPYQQNIPKKRPSSPGLNPQCPNPDHNLQKVLLAAGLGFFTYTNREAGLEFEGKGIEFLAFRTGNTARKLVSFKPYFATCLPVRIVRSSQPVYLAILPDLSSSTEVQKSHDSFTQNSQSIFIHPLCTHRAIAYQGLGFPLSLRPCGLTT